MRADGSGRRRLTEGPAWEIAPQWAPNGRRIVFVRIVPGPGESPHGGDEEIFVMDADGGRLKQLTESAGLDYAPAWRPDR